MQQAQLCFTSLHYPFGFMNLDDLGWGAERPIIVTFQ